jgi:hypothetical protein
MILAEIIPHPLSAAVRAEEEFGLASEMEIGGPGV